MNLSKYQEGNVIVIIIEGNLLLPDLEKPRKFVKSCIDDESVNKIIFDLSNVDFIDSAGIGFIVSVFKSIKTRNGKFALAGVKHKPKEVLKLTRIDKIIPIFDNVEMAKQEL